MKGNENVHLRKWNMTKACNNETAHGFGDITSEINDVTCSGCLKWFYKGKPDPAPKEDE